MASLVDSSAPALDPAIRALENAPLDDEPVTDGETVAVREAFKDVRLGDVYSTDQVLAMLDLLAFGLAGRGPPCATWVTSTGASLGASWRPWSASVRLSTAASEHS